MRPRAAFNAPVSISLPRLRDQLSCCQGVCGPSCRMEIDDLVLSLFSSLSSLSFFLGLCCFDVFWVHIGRMLFNIPTIVSQWRGLGCLVHFVYAKALFHSFFSPSRGVLDSMQSDSRLHRWSVHRAGKVVRLIQFHLGPRGNAAMRRG